MEYGLQALKSFLIHSSIFFKERNWSKNVKSGSVELQIIRQVDWCDSIFFSQIGCLKKPLLYWKSKNLHCNFWAALIWKSISSIIQRYWFWLSQMAFIVAIKSFKSQKKTLSYMQWRAYTRLYTFTTYFFNHLPHSTRIRKNVVKLN